MGNVREGGCQCGFVRYRIADCPTVVSICHCRDCQRQSGSAFGMSLALAEGAFELLSGELASFEVAAASGRVKTCAFCPNCGTRILHSSESWTSLKAGTLDDPTRLVPDGHWWTSRKQDWVTIPLGVKQFPGDG